LDGLSGLRSALGVRRFHRACMRARCGSDPQPALLWHSYRYVHSRRQRSGGRGARSGHNRRQRSGGRGARSGHNPKVSRSTRRVLSSSRSTRRVLSSVVRLLFIQYYGTYQLVHTRTRTYHGSTCVPYIVCTIGTRAMARRRSPCRLGPVACLAAIASPLRACNQSCFSPCCNRLPACSFLVASLLLLSRKRARQPRRLPMEASSGHATPSHRTQLQSHSQSQAGATRLGQASQVELPEMQAEASPRFFCANLTWRLGRDRGRACVVLTQGILPPPLFLLSAPLGPRSRPPLGGLASRRPCRRQRLMRLRSC
jgi:hypothetical protein